MTTPRLALILRVAGSVCVPPVAVNVLSGGVYGVSVRGLEVAVVALLVMGAVGGA